MLSFQSLYAQRHENTVGQVEVSTPPKEIQSTNDLLARETVSQFQVGTQQTVARINIKVEVGQRFNAFALFLTKKQKSYNKPKRKKIMNKRKHKNELRHWLPNRQKYA